MDNLGYAIGLLSLVISVYAIISAIISRSKAKKDISQSLKVGDTYKLLDSNESIELAKEYFNNYEEDTYKKYSKYIYSSESQLPLIFKPSLLDLIGVPLTLFSLLMVSIYGSLFVEEIYIISTILLILTILTAKKSLSNWNKKLVIDCEFIELEDKNSSIRYNYSDFSVLLTPRDSEFRIELFVLSNNNKELKKIKIGLFKNKKLISLLVTKSIQYGRFSDAVGIST